MRIRPVLSKLAPRRLSAPALLGTAVLIAGCGSEPAGSDAPGPYVVASTSVVADIAANVAGDRATVEGILPANSDPHDYEPRPSDAVAISEADLILASGGDLDLWLGEIAESAGSDAPTLELLDAVETIEGGRGHGHGHEDEHSEDEAGGEEVDPHWWQDPRNGVAAAEAIRDQLTELDPDGAATYERNADAYIAGIDRLDAAIARCIDSIPEADRQLVTSHDSLGYYAAHYGIEVAGAMIPALTTQAQPSVGETAELIGLIEGEGVPAVFPEVGVSAELEQTVADETGAEVGGELFSDTLGPEGSGGDAYLGMLNANTQTIAAALGGDPALCADPAGAGV